MVAAEQKLSWFGWGKEEGGGRTVRTDGVGMDSRLECGKVGKAENRTWKIKGRRGDDGKTSSRRLFSSPFSLFFNLVAARTQVPPKRSTSTNSFMPIFRFLIAARGFRLVERRYYRPSTMHAVSRSVQILLDSFVYPQS
ncbi:hypothetical protein QCA50_005262 [Cerrena zonata]|uniref:Uncharacterized protein n=1 Tax=Cerrena zonata TaxID=2478898 RepID=A0AAW0GED0_9APHY